MRDGEVVDEGAETRSLFQMGVLSNKPLLFSVLLTVVLQLAVIYMPWLNKIFRTAPLSPRELLIVLGLSSVVFLAVEAKKLITRLQLVQRNSH